MKRKNYTLVVGDSLLVDEDGGGVHCTLVDNDLDNPKSIQINENDELKHKSPDILELSVITRLNQNKKDDLENGMRVGMMTEEVDSCWRDMWNEMG